MSKEKTNQKMKAISDGQAKSNNNQIKEDDVIKETLSPAQVKERRRFILIGIGVIFLIGWVFLLASAIEVLIT